jgi:hypothetical protein
MAIVVRLNQLVKIMSLGCRISLFSLLVCNAVHAGIPLSKESKLKAAYLFNFTKFIEWPDLGDSKPPAPIRICLDDTSEFFEFLEQLVANRRVGKLKHSVVVLPLETASGCELLFVSKGGKQITGQFNNTVIVADSPSIVFPDATMVFYIENTRLRFQIDLKKIKLHNVVVSSELLKLASIKK